MNISIRVFLISVLVSLYAGCAGSPDISLLQDQFVKSRLIGTWRTVKHYTIKKETIKFNEDNTFTDTVFYKVQDLPGSFYVRYVAAGNYSVNDLKINFTGVQFKYYKDLDHPLKTSAVEYFDPRIPDIQDEFIFFRKSVSLTKDGSGTGLEGKWEINHWAAVYDADSNNKFSSGIIKEKYDFLPVSGDSGKCRYQRKYLFQITLPDEDSSYNYAAKGSYLNIDPIISTWYNITGSGMSWYGNPDDNMLYEKAD